jgi:hypothetical protein
LGCAKDYGSKTTLNTHLKSSHQIELGQGKLVLYVVTPEEKTPFVCGVAACTKRHATARGSNNHMVSKHAVDFAGGIIELHYIPPSDCEIPCPVDTCEQVFENEDKADKHIKKKHGPELLSGDVDLYKSEKSAVDYLMKSAQHVAIVAALTAPPAPPAAAPLARPLEEALLPPLVDGVGPPTLSTSKPVSADVECNYCKNMYKAKGLTRHQNKCKKKAAFVTASAEAQRDTQNSVS